MGLEFLSVGVFCRFQGSSGSESLTGATIQFMDRYQCTTKREKGRNRNCEDREVNEQRLFLISLVNFEILTIAAALNLHLSTSWRH
jgi:hypothetical protein